MDRRLDRTNDRAGDHERERTANYLGMALTQGYLELHEYEQRVQTVYQTQDSQGLKTLLADLPIDRIRRNDPRRHSARLAGARLAVRIHATAYLGVIAISLAVWAAVAATTDATYFWPVWPILGGAIALTSHAVATHRWQSRSR